LTNVAVIAHAGKSLGGGLGELREVLAREGFSDREMEVVTAKNAVQWTRTLSRVAFGKAVKSSFVHATRGKKIRIRFDRRFPYQDGGGARPAMKKLRIKVHPSAITVRVPQPTEALRLEDPLIASSPGVTSDHVQPARSQA
jgi:diacylglycerol kinase family enzyme